MENPVDAVSVALNGGRAPVALPKAGSEQPVAAPLARDPSRPVDTVEISKAARFRAAKLLQRQVDQDKPVLQGEGADRPASPGQDINFSFNRDLGMLTKQIVNSKTGEVEKQIPPEELVKLRARIHEFLKSTGKSGQADPKQLESLGSGADEGASEGAA